MGATGPRPAKLLGPDRPTGHEDIAEFLLQNGAGFCSYILMDNPELTKKLLRKRSHSDPSVPDNQSVCVKWSSLRLPWVDLDWFIDISCQIRELDISSNCLASLPSVVPWGLLNLQKLDLSDNQLCELPNVQSSEEIICSGCVCRYILDMTHLVIGLGTYLYVPGSPPLKPTCRTALPSGSTYPHCQDCNQTTVSEPQEAPANAMVSNATPEWATQMSQSMTQSIDNPNLHIASGSAESCLGYDRYAAKGELDSGTGRPWHIHV
ncbi:unnamed protein product [Ranitomeya imitator]|uniref:Uncharacterized protein n=1 Tax=Ranitomeya imitator TaxID=111125 RepID=A0ABN9MJG2_9NEOB|nr:unnamed protein product [Ranitomeya imitator]